MTMNGAYPSPPPADPFGAFNQYLWIMKSAIIQAMPYFKNGVFHNRINWSMKLVDCLHILIDSTWLDKHDIAVVLQLESDIRDAMNALNSDNIFETLRIKSWNAVNAIFNMVKLDAALAGQHDRLSGLDELDFEAGCR